MGETRCVLLYTTPILRISCGFDVLLVVLFISGQTLKLSMHTVGRQAQQWRSKSKTGDHYHCLPSSAIFIEWTTIMAVECLTFFHGNHAGDVGDA